MKKGILFFSRSKASARRPREAQEEGRKEPLHCSFCGKIEHRVRSLIAGPSVYICDACVEACVSMLGNQQVVKDEERLPEEGELPTAIFPCALCGLPTPTPDLLTVPGRGPICRDCVEAVCAAAGERAE